MKIHALSPEIISKIAAGEVIERPAFAVKELIENSIDAKATHIQIYLEDAGLKKIQITDNGEGMSKEDLLESFKPHTTSKISEDLIGISTLGFRGEALSSLAAISDLTIKSKIEKSIVGNEIKIRNNKLISQKETGMPSGTVVIADNLFENIPARRKFLKSKQTELRYIIDLVIGFSLSYPQIHFTLKHNSKILLDFPALSNISERINLFLKENFSLLIPLKLNDSYLKLSGFISKPQFHTSSTNKQFLFINNRKVTDRLINTAIKEAYGNMLEPTTYPVFVLYLNLPYEMVDVNVHPRKEQISLVSAQTVFNFIKQAVSETLQNSNLTFQNLSWKRTGVGLTNSVAGQFLKENVLEKLPKFRIEDNFIIQFNNLYILTQTSHGLLMIDQHAAHERIIFEKLKEEFLKEKTKTYKLATPITINFNKSEILILGEYQGFFKNLGIIFSLAKDQMSITHLPELLKDRNPKDLIKNLLESIEDNGQVKNLDSMSEEMLAFLACRAAVKAGNKLTNEQMKDIVSSLQKVVNNATCPHSRPTSILFSFKELNKMFGR